MAPLISASTLHILRVDMTPRDHSEESAALCDVCHRFGARQWCLATSGNFSVRVDATHCLITQSGKDKSRLAVDDLMLCTIDGRPLDATLTQSAETALHACLYRHDAAIAAVLHTHSVAATVMSRLAGSRILISGFEMQKALRGVTTHESEISIPVFDNSQDMAALASQIEAGLAQGAGGVPGFLIRGHGLYAWGESLEEATRHLEGFEFLIACALQEMRG